MAKTKYHQTRTKANNDALPQGERREEVSYHTPVLLHPSIDGLNIHAGGIYVDVTFGGGGHSREILAQLPQDAHLYSFDQDADAEQNIYQAENEDGTQETRFTDEPRFTFVRSNFRYLKNWMRYYGVEHIDGLLADLGVSSHHFDDETRGFSFRFDGPLDMRMNKRAGTTAADIVNDYPEEKLADVFYLYGELKNSYRIASAIVKSRANKRIETTQEFLAVMEPLFKREREKKDMARLFQALRIEVNHEMDALKEMLTAASELLCQGGRLSVITYHSLEDRIVKNFMKTGNVEGKVVQDFFGRIETPLTLVNNKVIVPDNDEQTANPRSRSAKLRIAAKK
uniref:Ribosomal RNA small subunit methyltransferase H n=1 Tax=Prevotella sp. GTC17260 TaxID=3236796 RepID=A0AB33JBQ4_9BACT